MRNLSRSPLSIAWIALSLCFFGANKNAYAQTVAPQPLTTVQKEALFSLLSASGVTVDWDSQDPQAANIRIQFLSSNNPNCVSDLTINVSSLSPTTRYGYLLRLPSTSATVHGMAFNFSPQIRSVPQMNGLVSVGALILGAQPSGSNPSTLAANTDSMYAIAPGRWFRTEDILLHGIATFSFSTQIVRSSRPVEVTGTRFLTPAYRRQIHTSVEQSSQAYIRLHRLIRELQQALTQSSTAEQAQNVLNNSRLQSLAATLRSTCDEVPTTSDPLPELSNLVVPPVAHSLFR